MTFSSFDCDECFVRVIDVPSSSTECEKANDTNGSKTNPPQMDIDTYSSMRGLLGRVEKQLVEKYDGMSLKQLKEECARKGISCSGLHYEYVKKLVSYEMEKRVGTVLFLKG